ncbi:hypothetical protein J4H86_08755 [Spiractinospora alimapuensis]|uniref:hypothetical protein n=1 Tax=Spiractinospora alimapuensis TaxID=2820884 RepID=UPI001F1F5D4B|nr:hypothetical protein [Spiractinospora alimapuensis]QVQ53784.1 hypothetical protein J4H86_08755 [Spiractinospora alimapuensis]
MGVALATAAVLVSGSLVANSFLPGEQPVRAGTEIVLSDTPENRMALTLTEDGWVRDLDGRKIAGDGQLFVRDSLELQAVPVNLAGTMEADANRLWEGFEDILRTRDADVRLGDPSRITSGQGVDGLTGAVENGEHAGVAVLYPAPNGRSAAQLVLSARDDSVDLGEAVGTVARSVAFTDKEEDA